MIYVKIFLKFSIEKVKSCENSHENISMCSAIKLDFEIATLIKISKTTMQRFMNQSHAAVIRR